MDYRIFNVHTDVNTCDCTRGCTDTCKRVFTEGWLCEKIPLLHQGGEPASAAWQSNALNQPSYIPTPLHAIQSINERTLCRHLVQPKYYEFVQVFPCKTEDNDAAGWTWAQYVYTERPDMQWAIYMWTVSSKWPLNGVAGKSTEED